MPKNPAIIYPIKFVLLLTLSATLALNHAQIAHAADITPPTTTYSISPSSPNGKNNWYTTPVEITLSATDLESGVKSINYKVDTGAWQQVQFSNTLNLAPNPSFENIDASNTPIIEDWDASVQDAFTFYTRDTANYVSGYETTSAKIETTSTGWHGINNQLSFSVAAPYSNMTASVWLKTQDSIGTAFFNVYVVSDDGLGNTTYTYVASSNAITGTTDWTNVSADFVVNNAQAVGIYLDIGIENTGTMWADAVSVNYTNSATNTSFTVGTNGNHTIEYYSIDNSNNSEAHTCVGSTYNCRTFKLDQDPPGNWHNAGAIRGLFGSDHELYVYTEVDDPYSGLSTFTDKFQYFTEKNPTFGTYSNLLSCSSTWQPNNWKILITPPFSPGAKTAYVITPKTDFCNNNWKICKIVRFYAEDMAGNTTTKDFCINGPWVSFSGGGVVRANGGIDMVSEADGDNTDGVIETGNSVLSFFTSDEDWILRSSPEPTDMTYDDWQDQVKPSPTTISAINTSSGVYEINGDYELRNQTVPNNYNSATFNQIVFIDGTLRISNNVTVGNASTALYIVSGDVEIDKQVTSVGIAIIADGDIFTAYNIAEGDTTNTLTLNGIYVAHDFRFQRTLQGTNNSKYPSEDIIFEPKYSIKMGDYLGASAIKWVNSN